MRTDVKVGIAVGLLIIIGLAGYWIFSGWGSGEPAQPGTQLASRNGQQDPAPAGRQAGGRDSNASETPRFGGLGTPARRTETPALPVVRPTHSMPPGPVIREDPPALPEPNDSPVAPIIRESPVTPVIRDTPSITEPVEPPVAPVIADTRVSPRIDESPIRPRITEAPVLPSIREEPDVPVVPSGPVVGPGQSVTPAVTPGAAGEQTYVVQEGDAGFWAVAEKAYGDGRYWTLIAKANPTADSNALRAGQRLTVPPRPVTRAAVAEGVERADEGGIVQTATGQVYVVKQGDAGFWGIAQKVYGDGKYWTAIAKANPSVNSSALKPGDRLTMPAKGEVAAERAPEAAPAVVAGPGQKIYTVDKADTSGFWGIAKKVYGDANFWTAIAKANPAASSSALKIGQKIVVPELTDAMRRELSPRPAGSTPRTPSPAGGRRPAPAGRPVFD